MNISVIDVINLVAAIVSTVLGVLAIWLALYFYTKAKDNESRVDAGLTGIKTQTEMLSRLHSKVLDKYTTYATSAKPADEVVVMLAQLLEVRGTASINSTQSESLLGVNEALSTTLVEMYIATLFYAGVSNALGQSFLPADISETMGDFSWAKQVVDQSCTDYKFAKQWLDAAEERVAASRLNPMYQEAITFEPNIQDTIGVYAARDQSQGAL